MKYKMIGIVTIVLVFVATVIVSLIPSENNGKRYIEHQMAEEKTPCEAGAHSAGELCTHLPILSIDTNGAAIPGLPIYQDGEISGYTTAENGATTLPAAIDVIDNAGVYNHLTDAPAISSQIQIRVRGNSSREFAKLNYFIKLQNADGTNNPQELLGMDAHHEWALHGPFLDKSLIRNYMWYNIAGQIMDYAPNVRFCEVIINGQYKGLYLLIETITAGKEGARLGLEVSKKNNDFSGYIVRLDRPSEDPQTLSPFSVYSVRTLMEIDVIYPGKQNMTDVIKENIKNDFSFFEKTIYSYDFDNPEYGYTQLIDVDSFADYFIINEITCNYDAGWLSTYMYKDIDGKFKMCVWDFNSACNMYQDNYIDPSHFELQSCLWYNMLIKDSDFTDRIIERYWMHRKGVLSDEYLENFIDDTIAYLGDAIDRNWQVWGYSFGEEFDLLKEEARNPRNYQQAITQMKDFLAYRTDWLDRNIEVLNQHSAASKNKKFNENAN